MKRYVFLISQVLLLAFLVTSCGSSASVQLISQSPTTNALPGACDGTQPLTDLKEKRYFGRMFARTDSVFLGVKLTRPGIVDTFSTVVQETLWDFWNIAYDSTGNPSCRSNVVSKRVSNNPSAPVMH